MVDAVHFEDHIEGVPPHIEDIASVTAAAYNLTRWFRETAGPASACDIYLAKRFCATHELEKYPLDLSSASVALDVQQCDADALRCGQPLLNDHGQNQRGLTIAPSPKRCANGSDFGACPWDTGRFKITTTPPPGLPDIDGARSKDTCATWHGYADTVDVEARKTGRDEAGCSVEHAPRARLEDPRPRVSKRGQWSGVDGDCLPKVAFPPTCAKERSCSPPLDTNVKQLAP
jgi:hypothetical protein